MHDQVFEYIGLTKNEARIYEFLLDKGESTISEIGVGAKIHRRNAYDAVQRLIDKGLCFQIFSSKGNKYNAVDPGKCTELLMERQKQFEEILPSLQRKYSERKVTEESSIYRGLEGQKNVWRDILRIGDNIYHIGAKAQWFDPRLRPSREAFHKEAKRKKIKFYFLWDYEVKEKMSDVPKNYPAELHYRYLPKEYSTNSSINIFGDHVVMYTGVRLGEMPDDAVFFVIKSKDLAESYRVWFNYMWEQSAEEN